MARKQSYVKSAQFYFALGHPRRLRIIDILKTQPNGLSFEDLEQETTIRGASLSHHLRFLKDAKIIHRQIRDRFSIYKLDADYLEWMIQAGSGKSQLKAA